MWGAGGVWQDSGAGLPDWLQIDFAVPYTIGEVNVFSLQENASNPVEPTPTMTTVLALEDFEIQYWDGAAWQVVPGGTVVGNTLVWAKVVAGFKGSSLHPASGSGSPRRVPAEAGRPRSRCIPPGQATTHRPLP